MYLKRQPSLATRVLFLYNIDFKATNLFASRPFDLARLGNMKTFVLI